MSDRILSLDAREAPTTFSLNGMWELEPGGQDSIPQQFSRVVQVPALVDVAEPPYAWDEVDFHYYSKLVQIIDPPEHALHFLLKIGQAQFGTAVWLNGKPVGGSISCYTSQEYRLDHLSSPAEKIDLLVRVGAKRTLPSESAVGKDQEKQTFIPGIWGDVSIRVCGSPSVKNVQIVPHIADQRAEARITVENLSDKEVEALLVTRICERASRNVVAPEVSTPLRLGALERKAVLVNHEMGDVQLWTPDTPLLYEMESTVYQGRNAVDVERTTFGMREFSIQGKGFFLNGKRIFLKGGNIAFHRFLSDKERKLLPWDREWIKRVLIDIPKAHQFNFFRNHLGQMYSAWYDIADEYGMLLQNEWQFWGTTGTKEQISKEFSEWLHDNWNHPSIVIWDALNESSDEVVQQEIVPAMKELDPTRPWESVDFVEDHPYIYSLGPLLNHDNFGFTRSLDEIESSPSPSVVNEFVWWWLDSQSQPTALMKDVVERWVGPNFTSDDLLRHQTFLVQELVELFRRLRADAIQPFVYLSNSDGPTSHWFLGPIAELHPKPILAALKNVFAPFGISIALWDRHFFPNENRSLETYLLNDEARANSGVVEYGIKNASGGWVHHGSQAVTVPASEVLKIPLVVQFPPEEGTFHVWAELKQVAGRHVSYSEKPAHVLAPAVRAPSQDDSTIMILESDGELRRFLEQRTVRVVNFSTDRLAQCDALIVAHGEIRHATYRGGIDGISRFVQAGGSLIVIEPEFSLRAKVAVPLLNGLDLFMEYRQDLDRGGYDSYLFAADQSHPLWHRIAPDHLKMFNGGFGGEIVSQHNVVPSVEGFVHARCGLGLKIPVVMEIHYGVGRALVSRLQVRSRLAAPELPASLYSRRIDPVLQQYMLNLVALASEYSRKGCQRSKTRATIK